MIKEEDKVKNFTWTITDPAVVIYNLIDDLETISEAAGVPKTINQRIQDGVQIIKKTGEFEKSLLDWFARPAYEHTWQNFKIHFTDAHTKLAKVRGSSMRGTVFHHANATVAALSTEMTNIRNDLMEKIICLTLQMQEDSSPPQESNPSDSIQDHQANAAMTNGITHCNPKPTKSSP